MWWNIISYLKTKFRLNTFCRKLSNYFDKKFMLEKGFFIKSFQQFWRKYSKTAVTWRGIVIHNHWEKSRIELVKKKTQFVDWAVTKLNFTWVVNCAINLKRYLVSRNWFPSRKTLSTLSAGNFHNPEFVQSKKTLQIKMRFLVSFENKYKQTMCYTE